MSTPEFCSACGREIDDEVWDRLRYVGIQHMHGYGQCLELRNCTCGTTLSRPADCFNCAPKRRYEVRP